MALRFLTFELEPQQRELRNQGRPVALSPKVFDVLTYLVTHRDRMVSKSELMDEFWPANVSEAALQKAISQLRKALGDTDAIKTHHGLGFRFVAAVTENAPRQQQDTPALREQRLAAVLAVRIIAETPLNATCEEAVENFLNTARARIETDQGCLMHMMIDGFTAGFGLDLTYEDGARRAVHCAVALRDQLRSNGALEAVFAIENGPVDVDVAGEAIGWNLPSHIERDATEMAGTGQGGDILLSQSTQSLLQAEVSCDTAAGGFRLRAIASMRAGIPRRRHTASGRFVGRGAEMAFLEKSLDKLRTGSGQAVLLSGVAGIGKTRLVSEFLGRVDGQGPRTVTLQCLPGLSNSPRALIRDICLTLLSDSGPLDDIDAALLQELLEDTAGTPEALKTLSEHQLRQRSQTLFTKLMAQHCDRAPLVLALEDVHWIDATSQDYLARLIRDVDAMGLLIVMTTRPLDTPSLTEAVLNLSPLGHQDSLAVLRETVGIAGIDPSMAEQLVKRAAGNPFFIEELAMAAQSGRNPATELPETVQAVIGVRMGALQPDLRALLHVMAVIGPPAPAELTAHLLGRSQDSVAQSLDQLVRAGFVQLDEFGYSFRHMLINDTAYAMLAPRERRRLHGEIADYLEAGSQVQPARPEILAWHQQEAGRTDRAIEGWTTASRAALARSARPEAITFARNGLALISEEAPETARSELALQLCLGTALTALRGYGFAEVGEAFYRARELSQQVGNRKAHIRVEVGLWIHTWVAGRLTESLGHADELLKLADQVQDPALRLQAHASMGEVLMHKGRFATALHHLQAGLVAIGDVPPSTLPEQNSAVACASYAAWVCSLMGQPNETHHYVNVSHRLRQVHENPFARAIHNALCAEPFMFMDDVDGCMDCADRAIAISREHDFAFWLGTGLIMRGWALGRRGDFTAAFAAYDEGIDVFEGTGAGVQLANWYGLKAETLLAAGQIDDGLREADHALHCADKAEDVFFLPRIHSTAAQLWERVGDSDRARQHAEAARKHAKDFGMSPNILVLG